MSKLVRAGASLTCSQGTLPARLQVLPGRGVAVQDAAAATVNDAVPLTNIPVFGKCNLYSPIKPCLPATQRWLPGSAKVRIRGDAALTSDCRLLCNAGGMITIISPGQQTVQNRD
jgi:hypothetical protein